MTYRLTAILNSLSAGSITVQQLLVFTLASIVWELDVAACCICTAYLQQKICGHAGAAAGHGSACHYDRQR
jgi:hypothetical protein